MRVAHSRNEVTLRASSFADNSAESNGGALYSIASKVSLERVTLASNKAEVGGAIYSTSRVDASASDGGGAWADQLISKDLPSLVTCKECIFETNQAVKGGACAFMGDTVQVTCIHTRFVWFVYVYIVIDGYFCAYTVRTQHESNYIVNSWLEALHADASF